MYEHIITATPDKHIYVAYLYITQENLSVTQIGYPHARMMSYLIWSIPACRVTASRIQRYLSYVIQRESTCSGPCPGKRPIRGKIEASPHEISHCRLPRRWARYRAEDNFACAPIQPVSRNTDFSPSLSKTQIYSPMVSFSLFRSLQSYRYSFLSRWRRRRRRPCW